LANLYYELWKSGFIISNIWKPRPGFVRSFLSAFDLHKFLQLTIYKGCRSRWWARRSVVFRKLFLEIFGCSQIIESTHLTSQTTKKLNSSFAERCLPDPSLSSIGFIHVLGMIALDVADGVAPSGSSEAAATLLGSFFESFAASLPDKTLVLELTLAWRLPVPRPRSQGCVLKLPLRHDFSIDLSPVQHLYSLSEFSPMLSQLFDESQSYCDGALHIRFRDFYTVLNTIDDECSFCAQLSALMGKHIEYLVGSSLQTSKKARTDPTVEGLPLETSKGFFKFSLTQHELETMSYDEVNSSLSSYVSNSKVAIGKPRHFSIALDKGVPSGMPLYCSALALPTNVCAIGLPQVLA
jgi:hypothetical protein